MNDIFLLLELSTTQLQRNTDSIFKGRDDRSGDVSISNVELAPSTSDNTLTVTANATTKDGDYTVKMLFEGVEFFAQQQPGAVSVNDANELFFMPISKNMAQVKVTCECLDFYWRFAFYNFNNKALLGQKPKPYTKVPGSNRGPVNPTRTPGICKHLYALVEYLQQNRIIK